MSALSSHPKTLQSEKIIHYCWFGGKPFPPLVEKCMHTWNTHLMDWKIMRWDETNMPKDIPYLNYALEQKLYAFAADFMRFYALNQYGGIYLDTDMEVLKDLSPLLTHAAFSGSETQNGTHVSGGVIGGQANALFFQKVLEKYTQPEHIIFRTIPKILNEVYHEYPDSLTVLPFDYFYPYNPYEPSQSVKQLMFCDISTNTYAIHHWHKSWKLSKWQKFLNSLKKRL